MAPRSKHKTGNQPQQNTRFFSVRNTLLALTIFSFGYAPSGYADAGDPIIDGEFKINTETINIQSNASVAMDADGDFVVVWQSKSSDQDNNDFGIIGQRYNASGKEAGTELYVNSQTLFEQINPSVAMDANGNFVVIWQSFKQDSSEYDVRGQRYNALGVDQGDEFLVNSVTVSNQSNPSVAMAANGDFVVIWQSNGNKENETDYDVYGRLFEANFEDNGEDQGVEFLVNSTVSNDQINPSVAMAANGDFVVIWQSNGNKENETDYDVYGRLFEANFEANGEDQSVEFLVNSTVSNNQINPSVSMDALGYFVVAWQSDEQDDDDLGIFGQSYNAHGDITKLEFLVNTEEGNDQFNPDVAMDASGNFVITWQSNGNEHDNSERGVFGQRYNTSSEEAGVEFPVNSTVSKDQINPSIAMDADGDFIVAWQSDGNTAEGENKDDSGYGVFGQRYQGNDETIHLDLVVNVPERVTTGNNFTYELITTNSGDGIAMNIELVGAIPAGVTYISDDSASAGWLCPDDASKIVCNLPYLNPGANSTIYVTVRSDTAGRVDNTVTVSSAQTNSNPVTSEATTNSFHEDSSISSSGGSLGWLNGVLLLFALRRKK